MRVVGVIVLASLVVLAGCSAPPKNQGTAAVAPGRYDAAFDHARETLVGLGFTLDRVDASAGVLTTEPLDGRGLAAPWERQQASRAGEIADAVHPQSRIVRIEFLPAESLHAVPSDLGRDQITSVGPLRRVDASSPLAARVTVLIERTYRPGMRPQVTDVLRSRRAFDPEFDAGREFSVVVQRDAALENAIAQRIADRIARAD